MFNAYVNCLEKQYRGEFTDRDEVEAMHRNKIEKDALFTPKEKNKMNPLTGTVDMFLKNNIACEKIIELLSLLDLKYISNNVTADSLYHSILHGVKHRQEEYTPYHFYRQVALELVRYPKFYFEFVQPYLNDGESYENYCVNTFIGHAMPEVAVVAAFLAKCWNIGLTVISPEHNIVHFFHDNVSSASRVTVISNNRAGINAQYSSTEAVGGMFSAIKGTDWSGGVTKLNNLRNAGQHAAKLLRQRLSSSLIEEYNDTNDRLVQIKTDINKYEVQKQEIEKILEEWRRNYATMEGRQGVVRMRLIEMGIKASELKDLGGPDISSTPKKDTEKSTPKKAVQDKDNVTGDNLMIPLEANLDGDDDEDIQIISAIKPRSEQLKQEIQIDKSLSDVKQSIFSIPESDLNDDFINDILDIVKDVKSEAVKAKDELRQNTDKAVDDQVANVQAVDEGIGTGIDPGSLLDRMAEGYIPESNLPENLPEQSKSNLPKNLAEQSKEQLEKEFEEELGTDLEVTLVKGPDEQVKTNITKEAQLMLKELWGKPEIEAIKIDGGEATAMKEAIKIVGNKLKEQSSRMMENPPRSQIIQPGQVLTQNQPSANPMSSQILQPGQVLTPKQPDAVTGAQSPGVSASNRPVYRTVEGRQVSVCWGKVLKNPYKFWCDLCGMSFTTKSDKTRHMISNCPNATTKVMYVCDFCTHQSSTTQYKNEHMHEVHYKKYLYHCDRCGKGFYKHSAKFHHKSKCLATPPQ